MKSRNFPFHPRLARGKPNLRRTGTVYARSADRLSGSLIGVGEVGVLPD